MFNVIAGTILIGVFAGLCSYMDNEGFAKTWVESLLTGFAVSCLVGGATLFIGGLIKLTS